MSKRIAVITLVLALLACMCSCKKIPTPTETASTFLTAVKAQDKETLATVYSEDSVDLLDAASDKASSDDAENQEDAEASEGLTKVYEEQMKPKILDFDYEISNEQIDGDKATVDVKITTYKLGDAFTAFIGDYMSEALVLAFSNASEEELDSMASTILSGKLADLSEKEYEKTVSMSLTMKDDKWIVDKISDNDDLVDALTGGLVTAFSNMEDAFSAWEE